MKYYVKTIDRHAMPWEEDFISSEKEFETLN